MLSWLLLASTGRRRISRSQIREISQDAEEQLLFEPEESLVWIDDNQTVAFLGWQSFTDTHSLRSHWHISPDRGLVAFAGHVWPTGVGWSHGADSWASQLDRFIRGEGGLEAEELSGIYSIVSVGPDRRGLVVADPYGVGLIYESTEQRDMLVLGSRAAMVAAASSGEAPPDRDSLGMAWMANFAYVVGSRTSYSGVSVADAGTRYILNPRGIRQTVSSPFTDATKRPDVAASMADVTESLSANTRVIAQLAAGSGAAQVSGGKDSRLVLGLLQRSDSLGAFELQTFGYEAQPDVVTARLIADYLGRPLSWKPGKGVEMSTDEFRRRSARHVYQSSGMFGLWDLKGTVGRTDRVVIGGLFGELFRSHFAANKDLRDDLEAMRDEIDGLPFDAARILLPEVRSELDGELAHWFEGRADDTKRPSDLLDLFYMDNRLRRWFGTAQEINGVNPQAFPLESVLGTRAALQAGHRRRRLDSIHFEIMRNSDKGLTYLPFAQDSWHPSLWKNLPDAGRYREVTPVAPDADTASTAPQVPWQIALWDQLRPVFEEILLDEVTSPIYDIVDRGQLIDVITGRRRLDRYGKAALFATLGAAIWLNKKETPIKFANSRSESTPTHVVSVPSETEFDSTSATERVTRRLTRWIGPR